jgi:hypothetical protein
VDSGASSTPPCPADRSCQGATASAGRPPWQSRQRRITEGPAFDPDHPTVSRNSLRISLPEGLTLEGLRQDRILDEAFATGDPLKFMRLFGITDATAMRHVGAAYPERTAKLPR